MARQESDREDLFAELAALRPRIELRVAPTGETVCAGRRESTGGWSLFLSPDRVYHFDNQGGLRRAFVAGFLFRSEGETLSRLRRERTPTETALLRTDLSADEVARFLDEMRGAITGFLGRVRGGEVETLRAEPATEDVLPALCAALEQVLTAGAPLSAKLRG